MNMREARVRLEGALELVEAGAARYRSLKPRLKDVHAARADFEVLIDSEAALEEAAAGVERLLRRGGPKELARALAALGQARSELRLSVRKRLTAIGVEPMLKTFGEEVALLLASTLPPAGEKVAGFDLRTRADFALAWACVLSAVVFFSAAAFAPEVAWLASSVPVVGAVTAYFGSRRKVHLYADRVRLVPRLGAPREAPLDRLARLGPLQVRNEFEHGELLTLIELLKQPCFAEIGPLSGEEVYEAEAISGHETVAVVATPSQALLILEREAATLDAAVGAARRWTQPRAALIAQLLTRMPAEHREPIVGRLEQAGLLRTVSREALTREFRILW